MALILHIDASGETASVALSEHQQLIAKKVAVGQKEHASFLQPAIEVILRDTGKKMSELSAVAVNIGPGSYTGLRVALASAKGICFAKKIPLITLDTTYVMAIAAKNSFIKTYPHVSTFVLCPMIDARRMEVFLALYDEQLNCLQAPTAYILDKSQLISPNEHQPIFFFGTGAEKWKALCEHKQSYFGTIEWDAANMIEAAHLKFDKQDFASLEEAVPLYVKPFYSTAK